MTLDANWIKKLNECLAPYDELLTRISYNPYGADFRIVAETTVAFLEIQEKFKEKLSTLEAESILDRAHRGTGRLIVSLYQNWFSPFSKVYTKYKNDDPNYWVFLQHSMNQLMAARAIFMMEKEVDTSDSLINTFFDQLDYLLKNLNIFSKLKETKICNLTLYTALNIRETLLIAAPNDDRAKKGLRIVDTVIKNFYEIHGIDEIIKSNLGLAIFLFSTFNKSKIRGYPAVWWESAENDFNDFIKNLNSASPAGLNPKTLAYSTLSLLEMNHAKAVEFMGELKSQPDAIAMREPHLYIAAQSYYRLLKNESAESLKLGMLPFYYNININSILDCLIPSLNKALSIELESEDLKKLTNMKDEVLRPIMCNIIKKSPYITVEGDVQLVYEKGKSHTGSEIADIDINLTVGSKQIWVGMPIKSGVEIKEDTLGEKYLHQIMRPLIRFEENASCSILVTAKKCSINLDSDIKILKSRNMPIGVLQHEVLAKLLKYHGEL